MGDLVLSLFPGIGLLDRAFEEEGFVVVRGPDLIWGGDIRTFHPPAGKFDGVIGGPPCQAYSKMRTLQKGSGVHGDQIPEFVRVIEEAQPRWFLMENVPAASDPKPSGYRVVSRRLNNRWLGEDQNRLRKFWFGSREEVAFHIQEGPLLSPHFEPAVLAGHGPAMGQRVNGILRRDWKEMARSQGLPEEWIQQFDEDCPMTTHGRKRAIGNGVPLPMGRAVAKAVKKATEQGR